MSLRRSSGVVSLHSRSSTRPNLSFKKQSFSSIKGAYNCKHSRVRSLLLSPRRLHLGAKKIFLSHQFSFAICRETFCTFIINIVLQLGEFLALPLLKITKCLVLSLLTNASLFDSQLNCHSDKWPKNAHL